MNVVDLIKQDHREVERLFDLMQRDPAQRPMLAPVVAALLTAHSRAEESRVYPVVRDEAGAADDVAHSQEEHVHAEQMLAELRELDPDSQQFDDLLRQVMEDVRHHVEEEEQTVLPHLLDAFDATRLDELGDAFIAARAEAMGEMPGEATRDEIVQQARNAGIPDATGMTKSELHDELAGGASD